jgi:hypothetical protein
MGRSDKLASGQLTCTLCVMANPRYSVGPFQLIHFSWVDRCFTTLGA